MDLLKQVKWNGILLSVLMALMGFIIIIDPSAAARSICILIGWFMVIGGISTLAAYHYLGGRALLVGGLILLIPGIAFVIKPDILVNFVTGFLGLLILAYGLASVREAVENKAMGYKHWHIGLIIGIITLALSLVVLLYPFESASAVMMMAGAIMVVHGISNIISIVIITNDIKRMM